MRAMMLKDIKNGLRRRKVAGDIDTVIWMGDAA